MFMSKFKKISFRICLPDWVYVFLVFVLYRLPGLGNTFINDDASEWKRRGYYFGTAIVNFNWAGTAITYHPGVILLWSQFVAIKTFTLIDMLIYKGALTEKAFYFTNHFIQKFFLVIITSVLISLVYILLKKIIGKTPALAVVAIVGLEPFFLALARALHIDLLLSTFMFLSFLALYIGLFFNKLSPKKSYLYSALGGVFAGMAMLTKSTGLYLIPFSLFMSGFAYLLNRNQAKVIIKRWGIFVLSTVVTFIAIWPAMWVNPIGTIDYYLIRGVKTTGFDSGHDHVWFGVETSDPGFWFYPVITIGRYTPFLIAGCVMGIIAVAYKIAKGKNLKKVLNENRFYAISFFYAAFYFAMVTIVSKKLDRYSLPMLFVMSIFAVYALKVFWESKLKKGVIFVLAVLLIIRIGLLVRLHPDYLAYYSPYIGGLDGGRYAVIPKWEIGYKKVADYFNTMDNVSNIKVAVANWPIMHYYADFIVADIRHDADAWNADYFVLPVYSDMRNSYYKKQYILVDTGVDINIAGVKYYDLYKNEGRSKYFK